MLNDKRIKNEFIGLGNLNSLIKNLDSKINNDCINDFSAFVFEVTNFSRITRYLDYSFGRESLLYTIRIAVEIFQGCEVYSLITNEIVIIIENSSVDDIYKKGILFLEAFSNPVLINNIPVNIKIKGGIVNYPSSGDKTDIIYKNMSKVLLQNGKEIDNLSIFNNDFAETIQNDYQIMCQIYHAVNNDELRLEYQPKYNIADNSVVGAEALLRWDDIQISISHVIDIVEKTDLINHITKWVANEVVNQLAEWKKSGITTNISMNVSSKDLSNDFFLNYLIKCVEKSDIDPNMIGIELTERCIYENKRNITALLNKFVSNGFEISIDDYGTGHNSLKNALIFPYDNIKLDKFFIDNIESKAAFSLIEGIINTANELNINIIAEGVESETQYMILEHLGCHMIQGYYFSKPLKPDDYKKILI